MDADKKRTNFEVYRKKKASIKLFLNENDKNEFKEIIESKGISMQQYLENYVLDTIAKHKGK